MSEDRVPSAAAKRDAVAHLYHTLFTGLILTVVTRRSGDDAARWLETLFRAQHERKFLSSFEKLGLKGRPDAVASAAYHYLSNRIGGVDVEFMAESDRKAWVRFPPPRWVYPGAAICGVPSEVSRAMLRGWYAQNGVSLGNPRLGFVCTGQTVDCQPGLMGYFQEFDSDLADHERLQFRPGEIAPRFDPDAAPRLPKGDWPDDRLSKARRNYAIEYLRSGLPKLFEVFGVAEALHLARTAGWLVGAQLAQDTAAKLGVDARGVAGVAALIAGVAEGEGDGAAVEVDDGAMVVRRDTLRVLRGLPAQPEELIAAWAGLYEGLAAGHDRFVRVTFSSHGEGSAGAYVWRLSERA